MFVFRGRKTARKRRTEFGSNNLQNETSSGIGWRTKSHIWDNFNLSNGGLIYRQGGPFLVIWPLSSSETEYTQYCLLQPFKQWRRIIFCMRIRSLCWSASVLFGHRNKSRLVLLISLFNIQGFWAPCCHPSPAIITLLIICE